MKNTGLFPEAILEPSVRKSIQNASAILPRPWQWRLFTTALILSDILMMAVAFRIAYLIRFNLNLPFFEIAVVPDLSFYQTLVVILIPVWVTIFAAFGLYNRHYLIGGTREYSKLFNATTLGMFSVIAAGFLVPNFVLARAWLLMSWMFALLLLATARFSLRRVVYALRQRGYFLSPAIIVGANQEGHSLASQLIHWRTSGLYMIRFVDDTLPVGSRVLSGLSIMGSIEEIERRCRSTFARVAEAIQARPREGREGAVA